MDLLTSWIYDEISPTDTVLDLCCGICASTTVNGALIRCATYLAVDIWMPYLDQIKKLTPTAQIDITKDLYRFPGKSFDVVLCLDGIEHIEESAVDGAINNMERIARRRVLIFTPDRFVPMEDGGAWGAGNPLYQSHKSFVSPAKMEVRGYKIKIYKENLEKNSVVYNTYVAIKHIGLE